MSSKMIEKLLYVDNMTCINCENKIEQILLKLTGVEKVRASYSRGTVLVVYEENKVSLRQIKEAIEMEDYHVKEEPEGSTGKEVQTGSSKNERQIDQYKSGQYKSGQNKSDQNKRDYTNIAATLIILFAFYMIAKHLGFFNIFYNFPLVKEGMGYGMLFLIGLLTSIHCVAMCGGICLSQCVPKSSSGDNTVGKLAMMKPSFMYNLGRVLSYTLIGGIVGALGSVFSFSGTTKGFVQILAGIFMMIMGINMLGVFPWLRRFNPRMPKVFARKIYKGRSSNSPFYIGLLNGLMPCGPLQAMQIYALSTGSPLKGALSMFLFSVGTVPLMFTFGALGSLLSKKFTGKMMTASAVLVVVLGIFMFSNGMGLSGIMVPNLTSAASTVQKTANTATIENGVQIIRTRLSSGRYEPIVVQKNIPVKWIIQAEAGDINGCNRSIIVQQYGIQKDLVQGENIIEFTPSESGTYPFSCWMGMIRSKITVVDNLNQIDSNVLKDNSGNSIGSGGSCCGGASY
jgi:Uncharacterized conserved protein